LGTGENQYDLVRIGDDDLLVFSPVGRGKAGDHTLSWLNGFDHPFSIFNHTDQNPITYHSQIHFPATLL
jgi:hypothetical protein